MFLGDADSALTSTLWVSVALETTKKTSQWDATERSTDAPCLSHLEHSTFPVSSPPFLSSPCFQFGVGFKHPVIHQLILSWLHIPSN